MNDMQDFEIFEAHSIKSFVVISGDIRSPLYELYATVRSGQTSIIDKENIPEVNWLPISNSKMGWIGMANIKTLIHLCQVRHDMEELVILMNVNTDNLPMELFKLPALKFLFLSEKPKNIQDIYKLPLAVSFGLAMSPKELPLLEQGVRNRLACLSLAGYELIDLPGEIRQLPKLVALDLSKTRLRNLPDEIWQLSNLTSLNIFGNQIADLSSKIGLLTDLTLLNLSYNQLSKLPIELWQLVNLTSLHILNNKLTSLPAEIGELSNLTSLKVYKNQLVGLPPEIGKLFNLTLLDLQDNRLTGLPAEIGKLSKLTSLKLSKNQMVGLPPEIGKLSNLTLLDLQDNRLTGLPAEIGKLSNLTLLDLQDNRLTGLPAEIGKLSKLTLLDLQYNQLASLPAEIGEISNLTSLKLSKNQLTSLPAEIGKLSKLTLLDLSDNKLKSLPTEIGQLSNLMSLILSDNKLRSLPTEIGQLSNLMSLILSDNELRSLPVEIGQLSNLTALNLYSNSLISLPAEIGQLSNLTALDLLKNLLTSLPAEIGRLSKLTSLGLSKNSLRSLPVEIGQLSSLISLDLQYNQLVSLPAEIGQLSNLTSLDLCNNLLVSLPAEIGQLSSLTSLNLYNNRLPKLPLEIWKLSSLTWLDISSMKLTTLASEIRQLSNLITLDLSFNPLSSLPSEVWHISKLTSLNLSGTEITDLPGKIKQLSNLTSLALSNNQLNSLPTELWQLSNMTSLDISNIGLVVLPSEIKQLSNLTSLNLHNNPLNSLPIELWQLSNLISLDISDIGLTNLSAEIGQLIGLKRLILSKQKKHWEVIPEERENKIKKLPIEIQNLKALNQLDLRGNPLDFPPEILEQVNNPQAILNYFAWILDGKRKPLGETKILVVGQGSVGKTSIIKRLISATFDPRENKTDGIAIDRWQVENRSQAENTSPEISLHIWDFGGQEIMHATHQFFLTKRSLYMLVLDARLTQEENRVEYWLKMIQSFGGESPVLLVGNKIDQHPLDIDRTGLQKKYPNIIGILETSASTGAGMDELKAAITEQVNNLQHIRDLLPEAWFTIKTKLEELRHQNNFISHNNYIELCAENEVGDETSQRTLIGFLHDLGVVLHFQDDPRLEALGILNPQWVTNGVYKIINAPSLFQNKGVLTLAMLNEILSQPEYRSNRLFIVDMMKKFELCYDMIPDKAFLVPDLLPKDEPSLTYNGIPAFEYAYPVLPSSVITRFIVRMNHKIEAGTVWRTGVLLKIGDNQALVKADIEDKKITIAIDGLEHTRRDALSAIRFQLDEIHASIKGLNPQKRIPIPNAPFAEPLKYEYLLKLEQSGQESLPVENGDNLVVVNVRQMLSAIESAENRKEQAASVFHVYGGINDFTNGNKNIAGNQIAISAGSDITGSVTIGNENRIFHKSLNKIETANIKPELKEALQQLTEAVASMLKELPETQVAETTDDLEKLVDEATSPRPNKRWYSVSIEGLIQAAENLDRLGAPVISLAKKVLSLLLGE